jgi:hypothetical protein
LPCAMAAGRARDSAAAASAQAFDSAILALVTVLRRKPTRGAKETTRQRAGNALHSLGAAAEADRNRVMGIAGPVAAAAPSDAALQQLLGCLRTTDTGAADVVFEAACVLMLGELVMHMRRRAPAANSRPFYQANAASAVPHVMLTLPCSDSHAGGQREVLVALTFGWRLSSCSPREQHGLQAAAVAANTAAGQMQAQPRWHVAGWPHGRDAF